MAKFKIEQAQSWARKICYKLDRVYRMIIKSKLKVQNKEAVNFLHNEDPSSEILKAINLVSLHLKAIKEQVHCIL